MKRMRCASVAVSFFTFMATLGVGVALGVEDGARPAVPEATAEQLAAEMRLKACTVKTPHQEVYDAFNAFCAAHFGAEKEPMVYKIFGTELKFVEGGLWVHASETSAVIGFETCLPAKSHVEYGPTAAYGKKTAEPERFFYLHQHYLAGLTTGRDVHYRIVAVDERGNRLVGKDRTLTPRTIAGAVHLPGGVEETPYVLDKANTSYVLSDDLTTPGTAFEVKADGITLDLDGHTARYCGRGVTASRQKGLTLLNGRIIQGTYKEATAGGGKDLRGPNVLLERCGDVTLAGMVFEHDAPQESCVLFNFANGNCEVHHNVFVDKGTRITNRHGAGLTECKCGWDRGNPADFKVHHNLVKRARQNGLRFARQIYHNEIYIDSWSTNSFATGSYRDKDDHHHNRVFATGYNAYAFPWSKTNLNVHHNFVHMQAIDLSHRWGETWGDINMLAGLRLTNYGKGGQERDKLRYGDNVVIIRGRGKVEIRGTEFYSDATIRGLVCEDTTVVAEAQDETAKQIACVVCQGHYNKPDSLPVVYRNCRLISNICNVRFGDSYGKGNNHHIVNCTFTRSGSRDDYHTFVFGGQYWNFGHVIRDCVFGPGTAYNDVWWKETGRRSWYKVQWTLTLKAPPGAKVTIRQAQALEAKTPEEPNEPETAFDGTLGPNGEVEVPLTQCVIRPPVKYNWKAGTVDRREIALTPHTVTVTAGGKEATATVEMTRKRFLRLTDGVLTEYAPR
ncbi:MAG: hypothetical protein AMS16_04070 [Planctomycetes bacterium DG_58]|nr:MAG: hypothetical protein AMS16_04070 [Planctomycetes bacterium DG_58]